MRDYSNLITALRIHEDLFNQRDAVNVATLYRDAADVIEELLARVTENDWRVCENCSLQHFDSDGMRWCEELSMVVGGNFYCGFFEGSEPPKGVE